jgi:hypothetical protein
LFLLQTIFILSSSHTAFQDPGASLSSQTPGGTAENHQENLCIRKIFAMESSSAKYPEAFKRRTLSAGVREAQQQIFDKRCVEEGKTVNRGYSCGDNLSV